MQAADSTNARASLETLARDIAAELQVPDVGPDMDAFKWGRALNELRQQGELTLEEEQGLAGVYKFVSPGAHSSLGLPAEQMARLGRTLALNVCWLLLQNRLVKSGRIT